MTEYGRGPAPEPWHPDDPYSRPVQGQDGTYGSGWDGYQDPQGQGGHGNPQQPQDPAYGGGPQGSYDSYGGQGFDPYGSAPDPQTGQYPSQGGQQQYHDPYGQDPAAPAGQQYGGGHPAQGQDPYQGGGRGQAYGNGQLDDTGSGSYGGEQYGGGWDTGVGRPVQDAYGRPAAYGGNPAQDPYGNGLDDTYGGRLPQDGYGGQPAHDPYGGTPDPYAGHAAQDAYGNQGRATGYTDGYGTHPADPWTTGAMPQAHVDDGAGVQGVPAGARRTAPVAGQDEGWDPGPGLDDHAFFADAHEEPPARRRGRRGGAASSAEEVADEGDHGFEDGGRSSRGRRGRGSSGGGGGRGGSERSRSRKSLALAAALVVAVVAGTGWFGYGFYQDRFGPAPDYTGQGGAPVTVEIPEGVGGYDMGRALKDAGVVKSVDAFVEAQGADPQGNNIQAGVYSLSKGMSAKNAVAAMLNPANRNALIVPEGRRNGWVYERIDARLGLKKGSTEKVAESEWKSLGLPAWANDDKEIKDPLEGFLYPASYPVSKNMKPADVLKKMVERATAEYGKYDLPDKARELGLENPLDVVTVASLVQAEGVTHDDFRKMAAVVYNRLEPSNTVTNQKLEFDSAYNYLRGESNIDIPTSKIRTHDDPYNTYFYKGLTPGPIGNPGADAMKAATEPDKGKWMFFISIDCKVTTFSSTLKEHEKYVQEFNKRRSEGQDCE